MGHRCVPGVEDRSTQQCLCSERLSSQLYVRRILRKEVGAHLRFPQIYNRTSPKGPRTVPSPPRNSPRSITSVCQGRRPGGWELVSHSSVSPQPLVRAAAPPPARPCACSPACGPCLSFPAVVARRGCPGADDAIVRLRGFTLSRQSSPQQLLESARTLLSHFLRVSGDRQSFRRCSGP